MQTLTEEQRTKWATDGFIHLEGVFDAEEVEFLGEQVDALRFQPGWEPTDLQRGHYGWVEESANTDPEGFVDRRHLLNYHQCFIDLIDRPEVFDLVVDIMGPYLAFSMSQAIVRAAGDGFEGYTHTDGGEGLRRIRVTETSRPLAMKALYLLTDLDEPDTGNFTVFPGTHMNPFPEDGPASPHPHAPGAYQLTGKAGDCIMFSHCLWHGPAPNHSNRARKTLLYNYCQQFMRPYDYVETAADVLDQCSPRQRRLLGDLGFEFRPGSYTYVPEDQVEVITGAPG